MKNCKYCDREFQRKFAVEDPFCSFSCEKLYEKYEKNINTAHWNLLTKNFRNDPQVGNGAHTKVIDIIWQEVIA